MNKSELIETMSEKSGLSKRDSEKALNSFIDAVSESLSKKEKVQLIGFGSFEVVERAARKGRNPQTGEEIKIKKSLAPKFKAGAGLKAAVAAGKKKKKK